MHARKLLALAAAGVMLAGVSGCASPDQSSGDVVTLTYWSGFTGGDKQAYEDLIQKFNDEHENIQIDYVLQPWDSIAQKLPTSIASGSGPDLATPDYNVATIQQYAANGLALPLDDLIGDGDTQVPEGVLPDTIVDSFTVDGKLYAAPANFATLLLYYNKGLLDAAGIEVPTTMQQLQDASAALADGNGQYGIAIGDHDTIAVWPVLMWADGGDLITDGCSALASDESVSAVSTWATLIHDQKVSPIGASGQDADNLFSAGKAAFEINGPWAAGAYESAGVEFGLAPVPVGASGEPVTLGSTVPTIVSSSTKHPKEAQEFLAWWLSKDTQAQLSTAAAYAPSRTDMADDPAVTSNPTVAAFTAEVPNARLYLPTEKDFAKIDRDIFTPAIQSATQTGDASAALTSANEQLNTLLGCS
jgi:ABC-type glycerol-3-phosphate transport system substrate-binding protein